MRVDAERHACERRPAARRAPLRLLASMRVGARTGLLTLALCVATLLPGARGDDQPLAALKAQYRREPAIPFPTDNPPDPARLRLGKLLFFDPLLSGSGARSCATCHNPGLSWGDGLKLSLGERPLSLRSPTLLDIAWVPVLGWDGKYPTLESVAFGPMLSAANMNITEAEVLARLSAIAGYRAAFAAAFPPRNNEASLSRAHIEQALAAFQRTIVAGEAPFDRWIAGDASAIDAEAQRGFVLFNGKAHCAECHSGPSFTDGSFQDIGLARDDEPGRGRLFPDSVKLQHAFKVPTLRDVARRGPYMHDGSLPDLAAVVAAYDCGGMDRPSRSELIAPLSLTSDERAALVAFLGTLTSDPQPYEVPVLPR
jgi:cytochrome c peroxidase